MHAISRIGIKHLIDLQALVQERHVTRAADRLGVGQPAMSASLAKLRALFKDELLVKTSSGMEPTPRALELVRHVADIVDLLEGRSGTQQSFDPRRAEMNFRIVSSDGTARLLIPELMRIAEKSAPRMQFTVSPEMRRIAEYLRDGAFDLAIVFLRRPPAELRQALLYPQKLVCIARKGHPDIDGTLSTKQFAGQRHAVWGASPVPYPTMEGMIDEALAASKLSRRVALRVSSIMLLAAAVARSDLLAVVPEPLAMASRQTLPIQVLPLPFAVPRVDISMLWHDRLHRSSAHKWLRATLRGIGKALVTTGLPTGPEP